MPATHSSAKSSKNRRRTDRIRAGARKNAISDVAVIGAGASGLAAGKSLLEAGFNPTVFEKASHLGGIWTFDEAVPDGGSPAYRSLHTNTPRQQTAFSDFPFPPDLPEFPPAADIVKYLESYAKHFNLYHHIRFNTTVESARPQNNGRWELNIRSDAGTEAVLFDAIFVCSGMFHEPLLPRYSGLDTFTGKLLHSRYYADATQFKDQRVLVVGVGSSGIDIAVELANANGRAILSGRNNAWEPAQQSSKVRPDAKWWKRLARNIYLSVRLDKIAQRVGKPRPDAPFVMRRDTLVMSDKLRKALSAEILTPRPDVSRISGSTVYFEDGTADEVDAIVCATGYALRFPFLDEGIFHSTPGGLDLYRIVFSPSHPTLAFIGMSRASGAILPFSEMQARWAAAVLRGKVKLPARHVQEARIEARRSRIAERNGNPFRLEFESYSDILAAEAGVLPKLWRHPGVCRDLLFGKPIAARYRLDGPRRSRRAASIIKAGNRVLRPDRKDIYAIDS